MTQFDRDEILKDHGFKFLTIHDSMGVWQRDDVFVFTKQLGNWRYIHTVTANTIDEAIDHECYSTMFETKDENQLDILLSSMPSTFYTLKQ